MGTCVCSLPVPERTASTFDTSLVCCWAMMDAWGHGRGMKSWQVMRPVSPDLPASSSVGWLTQRAMTTASKRKGSQMIRLVLSDLDNTLVPLGEKHATPRTIAAIHACLDAGVAFGPASGRNHSEACTFLAKDEACCATGVYSNGQQVMHEGRMLAEVACDPEAIGRLERLLDKRKGCALICYRDDGSADWVGDEVDALGELYHRSMLYGSFRHGHLPTHDVVKVGLIMNLGEDEEMALGRELERACPELDFHRTVACWRDVVPKGCDKASGLRLLLERLEVGPDEVCVFGDAENDLGLFSCVTHSCAVANATPPVKAQARWHIGASAEEGVAAALEDIAEATRRGGLPRFMQKDPL